MDASVFSTTESLIDQVISTWRSGARPDTAAVLTRYPNLRRRQSVLLDLAYEEYCLRKEAGEAISLESFCDRFPTCRRSLARLLAVHDCVEEDPELAESLACETVAWPQVGTEFQGFQLVRELGRGAFAHVYLAEQPALGDRLVVIKVALCGAGEAETLGRLAHRNIVPVYSVSEDPTTHISAVCMPYLGSATLLDVLDLGFANDRPPVAARIIPQIAHQEAMVDAIPETYRTPDALLQHGTYIDGVVHLAIQLAEALEHTHRAGICHRDLKPSNVLLTPSGCPMLLDFNLSAGMQLERVFVGGTLPYMAPESLRSMTLEDAVQDAETDPRSDLYSLGVILYELLTGYLPFGDRPPDAPPHQAAEELLARHRLGCPPVRRIHRQVNVGLARVVHQCLARDIEQRPASALVLADLLREQLAPVSRMRRWVSRRRFVIGAGCLSLGLISGIAAAHVSTRVPAVDRAYEAGIRAFRAGDFAAAGEHFTRAHVVAPHAYQPLWGRAQTLLADGNLVAATLDLESVYAMNPQGWTAAWLGFCHDCAGVHLKAEFYYAMAIEEYGYEDAAVWNNRGHGALQRGAIHSSIDYLTRAVELDPDCPTVYRNRALAYARCRHEMNGEGVTLGQLALQDIERAMRMDPRAGGLLLDAALVHWQCDRMPGRETRVLEYLTRALERGVDRQTILAMPDLGRAILARVPDRPTSAARAPRSDPRLPLAHRFPPLGSD